MSGEGAWMAESEGAGGWMCGDCGAPVADTLCRRCGSSVVPAVSASQGPVPASCPRCGADLITRGLAGLAAGASPQPCPICGADLAGALGKPGADMSPARPSALRSPMALPLRPVIAPVRRGFSERASVGWTLSRRCYELMKAQPGLLAVPAISTVVIVVVFLLASVIARALPGILELVWILAAVAILGAVSAGGQAVIVVRVGAVIHGGRCTNKEAFAAVVPKWKILAQWGAISLTVATLIRGLERGRGVLGFVLRLVGLAAAVAWSALTFFMVPVIVFEDVTIRQAFSRSRMLVRDS